MKKFNTVKDFLNHIPNCLICGKELIFHIRGNYYSNSFRLKFAKRTNTLNSLGRKYSNVSIDLDKNEFINGKEFIGKSNNIIFFKECKTCTFRISSDPNHNINCINMQYCILSWFEKNKKKIDLCIDYTGKYWTSLKINNKSISVPIEFLLKIDLSRYKNKKELYERIKTIITFS